MSIYVYAYNQSYRELGPWAGSREAPAAGAAAAPAASAASSPAAREGLVTVSSCPWAADGLAGRRRAQLLEPATGQRFAVLQPRFPPVSTV